MLDSNPLCVCSQEKFPPNIYYKIFTHRPVQDMCANSPKDYTAACEKLSMGRDIHNVKPYFFESLRVARWSAESED